MKIRWGKRLLSACLSSGLRSVSFSSVAGQLLSTANCRASAGDSLVALFQGTTNSLPVSARRTFETAHYQSGAPVCAIAAQSKALATTDQPVELTNLAFETVNLCLPRRLESRLSRQSFLLDGNPDICGCHLRTTTAPNRPPRPLRHLSRTPARDRCTWRSGNTTTMSCTKALATLAWPSLPTTTSLITNNTAGLPRRRAERKVVGRYSRGPAWRATEHNGAA